MATTSPPKPPAAPGPPPPQPPRPPARRPARAGGIRAAAVGALALVVLIVAYLLFAGSGGANYHLRFAEAFQLVRGDQVQVGGVPVGSVTNIELTKDFKADVTIHVDSSLTPLHEGTLAEIRVPSLSSVANRYVALSPGPNSKPKLPAGATLPATATKPVTDLDALFNALNPKTRKGLSQFLQGSAEQYAGASKDLGITTEYFPPALTATNHLFSELVLRPAGLHQLPGRNRKGRDDDRGARRKADRSDRKRQHDVHRRSAPSRRSSRRACTSCR